jgi:hypothetical protein
MILFRSIIRDPSTSGLRFHYVDLDIDIGATASVGAGVGVAFMDEPNGLVEFALTAEAMPRGVLYFLTFPARCFFTSAFLISIGRVS